MLHQSSGRIRYSIEPRVGHKVVIEIDQGIADFYRSLIPKSKRIQRQSFPAHISVVRKQVPIIMNNWKLHDGEQTEFLYENIIDNCSTYYWIHAFTKVGEQIREELGLPIYNSEKSPDGFRQRFHITLGNCK